MLVRKRIDYISLYLVLTFFLIVGLFFWYGGRQAELFGQRKQVDRLHLLWEVLAERTQSLLISARDLQVLRHEWMDAIDQFKTALHQETHNQALLKGGSRLVLGLNALETWWPDLDAALEPIRTHLNDYLVLDDRPQGMGIYGLLMDKERLTPDTTALLTRILNDTNRFLRIQETRRAMLEVSIEAIDGELRKKMDFRFKMFLLLMVVLCIIAYNINISSRRKMQKTSEGFESMVAERTQDLARINQRLKLEMAERGRMENQLMQSQKMESLGIVAGGVAHDFNNLLFGIMGNAELALINLQPGSPASNNIENVVSLGQRAAELTKQMLDYSGRGRISLEAIDLSAAVKDMATFLKSSIGKNTELVSYLSEDLPCIEADPGQINQVIMNLVTNASEALGDHLGRITISTGSTYCDRSFLERTYLYENQCDGDYVTLRVSDNGPGIEPNILNQIFDPFFTTKFTGRGLGLAAVLGIVRGQRGAITINSTLGQGTTFTIFFPVNESIPKNMVQETVQITGSQGRRTVLVVDDESHVLEVIQEGLQTNGFKVLTASDGQDGLGIFRMHATEIDLVLLDLTMPRMGGHEAFLEMQRLNPDIPVIVASGYSEEELTLRFKDQRPAGFIKKPFRLKTLIDIVNQILAG